VRLILSVDALTPQLSGIGRYANELATRLPDLAGVEAVRFYRNRQWVPDPSSLLTPLALHVSRKRKPGLRIKWPAWVKAAHWRQQCRGQVFHSPNYFLPPCSDIGVATIHDLSVFKFPETHPAERIKQFEREFAQTVARAARLITDSESTRQELIAFLGCAETRVTAIPLGVDARFQPMAWAKGVGVLARYGLQPDGYTLCVSTLEPRKKIDTLLHAYARLPIALRQAHPLVLVGGAGWLSDVLQAQIKQGENQGWLRYLGFVPEADLPALYSGAGLFVYPSIYEGFGLPVLEAMASGVPVITSNRTSLPEVSQGAALLLEPDDVVALSKGMEMAWLDQAWRSAARASGLGVAQRYTWDQCAQQTLDLYRTVIA
jgi:alpha-1,3-rhamnosyl/mannosyltransferase